MTVWYSVDTSCSYRNLMDAAPRRIPHGWRDLLGVLAGVHRPAIMTASLMLLANSQERISKGKKYTEARNVIPLEVPDVLTPCTKL